MEISDVVLTEIAECIANKVPVTVLSAEEAKAYLEDPWQI